MTNYQRTVPQLREVVSLFWPAELSKEAAQLSVLPLLLETQDQFLAILGVDLRSPQNYFNLISNASLPTNLFLKHLMVLADFGIGSLKRVNSNFRYFFPKGEIEYEWRNETHLYRFQALPVTKLSNDLLDISKEKLVQKQPLSGLVQDVIVLLLFGSVCTDPETADKLSQCKINMYLGQPAILNEFVKQRYIEISRIITGIKSNNFTKQRLILAEEVGMGLGYEEHTED